MAQTSYKGYMVAPGGGKRLIMQAGTHAFTSNSVDVTLTVDMRRVVSCQVKPNQAPPNGDKSAALGGIMPYVSSTQYTTVLKNKRVIVSRLTAGGSLGAKFSYTMIGY